ncbi:MAG TPA: hypothetical protein VK071_08985 [Tissierellales bacterium]|nr:hypothetical protein [Tissierellales bacterium]
MYIVEVIEELHNRSKKRLEEASYSNINFRLGDDSLGLGNVLLMIG